MRAYIVMILLLLTLSTSHSFILQNFEEISPIEADAYDIDPSEYIEHGPIFLGGDSDFQLFEFEGNGSNVSPYVIEGLYFNMNNTEYEWNRRAVYLGGITVYWVIRDCVFKGSNQLVEDPDGDWMQINGYGVEMYRTKNGIIENCTFIHLDRGINMEKTSDVIIRNDNFYGYTSPMLRDIEIEGETYYFDSYQNYGFGIVMYEVSNYIHIHNNEFYNWSSSILLHNSVYINVENNAVFGCDWGVQVSWSSWTNNITGNFFRHNLYAGIAVGLSSLLFITNNTLIENYRGIYILEMATGTHIAFNTLIGNGASIFTNTTSGFSLAQSTYPPGIGIWVSDGTGAHMRWNDFVDNDISARNDIADNEYDYNYYSDYSGTDVDNDDIGDTPYDVQGDAPTQDSHPRTKRMSYYTLQTTTQSSEQPNLPVDTLIMLSVGGGIILVAMAIVFMKRK